MAHGRYNTSKHSIRSGQVSEEDYEDEYPTYEPKANKASREKPGHKSFRYANNF